MDESQSYLIAAEHRECYDGLIKSYDLDESLFSTYDKMYSLKRIQKDKDKNKDPSAGSDQWLKKRKTTKDAEPTSGPKTKESKSGSSKGGKSQSKSFGKSVQSEEPEFEDNPEGGDYPYDLTKPIPLVMNGKCQMVPVEYFFNNDLKYLQGGILTMMYTTSITKTKAAQYDLPGIKDMARNILKYLREIEVRRADNDVYTFKEGIFPRLRINDIEDMLILIVQNMLTNILGDDRRWSSLEKKRANIMIKAINKKLKERRIIRSLEKFVGGRHSGTDLQLLQRTI
nr:hypothetical protein [Tanacetum cinerariifolium]